MRTAAIIVNIFFPGVGSLLIGKVGQGIAQILLYLLGVVLIFTFIGAIVGGPLCLGVWIWAIVTAVNAPTKPIEVTVVHKYEGAPPGQ
jgi:TM2 domain-containing membrane protein YozV